MMKTSIMQRFLKRKKM